ncbi:MAG TPA: nitronate monooxygenase [Streptosporangiaceae bacterium]|jgi:nitronate monooxygenase
MSAGDLLGGLAVPVVQAPMAGATTPAMAAAATEAGGLGFLAAGYRTASGLAEDIAAVRARTTGAFGVNVFVPGRDTGDPAAVAAYADRLRGDAERLGAGLGDPVWRDDAWDAKLALLRRDPVPVVTFTFGCPSGDVLAGLRGSGSTVGVTVTTPDEARAAEDAGAEFLCVQGAESGGHQGSFSDAAERTVPLLDLLAAVRAATPLPLVAAGAIMTGADVARVCAAGAVAAQCGTAFLRTPESAAKPAHQAALTDPAYAETAVTRVFSGRRARGLVNTFMRDHSEAAPAAYPQIHYLTSPLRAAAAKSGNANALNLWAGTAHTQARAIPTTAVMATLANT